MPTQDPSTSNRTLERVAAILDAVEIVPATASELSRRTGLSVSTAHRLALSMAKYGFLRRTDESRFQLGQRFEQSRLEQIASAALQRLQEATGETVQLWVRRDQERLCMLSIQGIHELRVTLPVGARLPLPAGSSGLLLAQDPVAQESLAKMGWVESIGGRTPGLGSVSAPVRLEEDIIAAVCVPIPLARVQRSPGQDFGDAVTAAAESISRELELGAV